MIVSLATITVDNRRLHWEPGCECSGTGKRRRGGGKEGPSRRGLVLSLTAQAAGSISPASSPRRVGFSDAAAQALVEPVDKVQQRPVWSCCYPSTSTLRDPEAASLTRTHRGCYPSLGVIQGYTRNSLLSIAPTYATGKNSEVNPLEDFRFPSTVVPGIERKRDFLIRPPPDYVCFGKQAL